MRENAYTKADDNVVKALDKLPLVAFVPTVGLHGGAFGGAFGLKNKGRRIKVAFFAFLSVVFLVSRWR